MLEAFNELIFEIVIEAVRLTELLELFEVLAMVGLLDYIIVWLHSLIRGQRWRYWGSEHNVQKVTFQKRKFVE